MTRSPSAIVVASNRGPVTFERDDDGRLAARRGVGGLVTALSGVLRKGDATWVAAAMNEGDREVAARGRTFEAGGRMRARFVDIPKDLYDGYYAEIANRLLWMVHHYLFDLPRQPQFGEDTRRAWESFVMVNRMFAEVLSKEAAGDPAFLIQDYHLCLVPQMLRERFPDARIVHFSHTPFAGQSYLRILPQHMREAIVRGMAGSDVIAFQARTWAENFLLSARQIPGLRSDVQHQRIRAGDRTALVRRFPVAVNPDTLREVLNGPEAQRALKKIDGIVGETKMLLRVDRLEPTKNILRGFLAYEQFLRRHPEWWGRVTFVAQLTPSRESLSEYQNYGDDCMMEIERINEELGETRWKPIHPVLRDDFPFALAAYARADAMIVNPVYDGMNLVSMEGPLLNARSAALVLSFNAGAYGLLHRHVVGINPFDVQETADALHEALEMPEAERARRARGMRRAILSHTPEGWLQDQLEALGQAVAMRGSGGHGSPH